MSDAKALTLAEAAEELRRRVRQVAVHLDETDRAEYVQERTALAKLIDVTLYSLAETERQRDDRDGVDLVLGGTVAGLKIARHFLVEYVSVVLGTPVMA